MRLIRYLGMFILLFLSFFVNHTFASQMVYMSDSNNWNIRFDGPHVGGYLATGSVQTGDMYGTGNQDIVVVAPCTSYNGNNYSGSIYIIAHSLYSQVTGKGVVLDLSDSANYTLRIDGPVATSGYPNCGLGMFGAFKVQDLDDDGYPDLIVNNVATDYNSRTNSGSVYVLYNSLIRQHTNATTGNTMYLAHTNGSGNFDHFNLRFDGPDITATVQGLALSTTALYLGRYVGTGNLSSTGTDLVFTAQMTGLNGYRAGSTYIFSHELLSTWSNVGTTIDLTSASNYTLRIDGAHAFGSMMGYYVNQTIGDLDNDGKDDMVIGVANIDDSKRYPDYIGGVYILYNSILLPHLTGVGNSLDLGDTSNNNYNILMQTGQEDDVFGWAGPFTITDLNNDGNKWLIVAGNYEASNGRTKNGSVYVFPYSILKRYTGVGNNINLTTDPTSYYLRLDGAGDQYWLGDMFTTVLDRFGTGKKDLVTGGPKTPSTALAPNGPNDWGWVYVVSNEILNNHEAASGNVLDMADSSSYSLLYQGAPQLADSTKGSHLVAPMTDNPVDVDLNGDGSHDSVFAAHYADFTNMAKAGSLYVVYNFPHVLSLDDLPQRIDNKTKSVSGSITATNSVTTVKGVEYSFDTANYDGTWHGCVALDGAFDSISESFSCNLDFSELHTGDHSVKVRAYDSHNAYTAVSNYHWDNFKYVRRSSNTEETKFVETAITSKDTVALPSNNSDAASIDLGSANTVPSKDPISTNETTGSFFGSVASNPEVTTTGRKVPRWILYPFISLPFIYYWIVTRIKKH